MASTGCRLALGISLTAERAPSCAVSLMGLWSGGWEGSSKCRGQGSRCRWDVFCSFRLLSTPCGSCLSRPRTTGSLPDFPGLWLKQAAPHPSLGDHVHPLYVAGAVGELASCWCGALWVISVSGEKSRGRLHCLASDLLCWCKEDLLSLLASLVPLVASFKHSPSPHLRFTPLLL